MCLPLNHGTRIYVKTHEIDNNIIIIIIIKHTNNKHTKLDKEEKMKIRYDIWCKLVNLSTRIIIITNYEKKMQIFVFLQFFFYNKLAYILLHHITRIQNSRWNLIMSSFILLLSNWNFMHDMSLNTYYTHTHIHTYYCYW